jgi:hypothetical protein
LSRADKPITERSRSKVDESAIKLHRRELRVGAHIYQVLSPRPGTTALWATNYFHHTWHIVCDAAGWKFMARLFWGLACDNRPNTLVWIGPELLQPVPFDQEKSLPVMLVPSSITHVSGKELQSISAALRKHVKPTGTVCWRTWSLSGERDADDRYATRRVRTSLEAGAITVRADSLAWRTLARWLKYQSDQGLSHYPTTYEYLDDANTPNRLGHSAIEGEIQFYRDFARISRRTANARQHILDRQPGLSGEELRDAIHQNAPAITWK